MRTSARLRTLLAHVRTATENNASYLVSLNLKALQKTHKKAPDQDPRAFFTALQEEAKKGPIFPALVIDLVEGFPFTMEKHETQWIATQLAQKDEEFLDETLQTPNFRGFANHVHQAIDWIRAEHPDLKTLSLMDAFHQAEEWHKQFKARDSEAPGNYPTNTVVHKWPDGYRMVELGPDDCSVEGDLMGHCVGGYAESVAQKRALIYSLRDSKNRPHVTIEVDPRSHSVVQIQGKENKEPVAKYHPYLDEWLQEEDLHDAETLSYRSPKGIAQTIDSMLHGYVEDVKWDMLDEAARLEKTLPETLNLLASQQEGDRSLGMRVLVARNPNTLPETLDQLSKDKRAEVRHEVAKREELSEEVLDLLARDKDDDVFDEVMNHRLSDKTLRSVVESMPPGMRYRLEPIASHMNASAATLQAILDRSVSAIGWDLAKALAHNSSLTDDQAEALLPGVTKDHNMPALRLMSENKHLSDEVREKAAKEFHRILDARKQHGITARLKRLAGLHTATESNAEYLVGLNLKALQKTHKKTPDQDARTFYEGLRELAKKGPLFSPWVLKQIHNVPFAMEKQEAQWLATQLMDSEEKAVWDHQRQPHAVLRDTLDYLRAEHPPLDGLGLFDAIHRARDWHEQFKGKGENAGPYATNDVVKRWDDGFTMVRLSPADCETEGDLMGHCVGGYAQEVAEGGAEIYSLRDPKGKPHVTIEVKPAQGKKHPAEIVQIQGKENKDPVEKYHRYVSEWLHENDLHSEETFLYRDSATFAGIVRALVERHQGKRTFPSDAEMVLVRKIAESPRTPEDALNEIVSNAWLNDSELQSDALHNPNATERTLLKAVVTWEDSNDDSMREEVYLELAGNKRATDKVLARLLDATDYVEDVVTRRAVLYRIAENRNASDETKSTARRLIQELGSEEE